MQDNCITIQLRLPGVKVLDVKEERHWIEVLAQYRTEEAECPRCGRSTWQVHQWHLQQKRDARLWKKVVYLALLKRRFRCRRCRKVFMEPDPVCGARRRYATSAPCAAAGWPTMLGATASPVTTSSSWCEWRWGNCPHLPRHVPSAEAVDPVWALL